MSQNDYLVWMDMEMTGLDPERDVILEIATIITDGNYTLRLTTHRANADPLEHRVAVRVRNYTPIETATPHTPAEPVETGRPAETRLPIAASSVPTLTPLPTNPAELTPRDVTNSIQAGGLVVIIAFILLAIVPARL